MMIAIMLNTWRCVVNGVNAAHKANGLTTKITMPHFTPHMFRTHVSSAEFLPFFCEESECFAQKKKKHGRVLRVFWGPRPSLRRPCASAFAAQQRRARVSPPQTFTKLGPFAAYGEHQPLRKNVLCRGFLCIKSTVCAELRPQAT